MDPYQSESTELRWFGEGALPASVESLSASFPDNPAPFVGSRCDRYVVSTDPALGIKLREGKLEIKTRRNRHRSDATPGFIEEWAKWSWSGAGDPFGTGAPLAPWISVDKVRALWKYAIDGGGIRVVSGIEHVDRGGAIELTGIRVSDREYWSVAIEAFALGEGARRDVEAAAGVLTGALPGVRFTPEASVGYAEWLPSVARP